MIKANYCCDSCFDSLNGTRRSNVAKSVNVEVKSFTYFRYLLVIRDFGVR